MWESKMKILNDRSIMCGKRNSAGYYCVLSTRSKTKHLKCFFLNIFEQKSDGYYVKHFISMTKKLMLKGSDFVILKSGKYFCSIFSDNFKVISISFSFCV